jgi:hypothetical protein
MGDLLDKIIDFFMDGPGSFFLVFLILGAPIAFILFLNIYWIMNG